MKKLLQRNHLKAIFVLCTALPTLASAQSYKEYYGRPSYWRPYDQRGVNVFETSKEPDSMQYEGPRIRIGAGFTQQFQDIKVESSALNSQTANKLYPVAPGFMTAMANLYTDIQLSDGIHLNVTTYLSTRHHNEAWVKGGYIQFDKLPFKGRFWDRLMDYTTIKVGHMEVNYGDAHFRRSDGGQAIYNPFMESYIMDAYATEIGGEITLQDNGVFGMLGVTNGMIKGNVDSASAGVVNGEIVDGNKHRSPSLLFKGGIDRQITPTLRARVTASYYHNSSSAGSGLTLYGGDRAGSNYQNVVEKWKDAAGVIQASTAIAFSGRLNPGFSKKIDAAMFNGFIKWGGLELFGTYEAAVGRTKVETEDREADQYAADLVYRFGKAENLFAGIRYNAASARMAGMAENVNIDRLAFAGGWFLTRNILMKAEYVIQNYKDFPASDYRSGGKFSGYVVEAVVGF